MKVEYRCNYCLCWVGTLDELEMHRFIHTESNPDIVMTATSLNIVPPQIAQSETESGDSK